MGQTGFLTLLAGQAASTAAAGAAAPEVARWGALAALARFVLSIREPLASFPRPM